MRAKVLPIANQKGGVGKTTTALTLGAALGHLGKKVLIMDLDPHISASVHLQYYPERLELTAYDIFKAEPEALPELWNRAICWREGQVFDFIPASIRLSELEIDLSDRHQKGEILTGCLDVVRESYEYILLDAPPNVGIIMINALMAADTLIIPIQTEFLALNGMRLLFDTIRTLNRVLDKPISYRVLATMFDQRANACRRVLSLLRKKMGNRMFENVIHVDTKFREACAHGMVIYDLAPQSRGAKEYLRLAQELVATL